LYVGFGLTDPYVLEQIAHVLELSRGNVAPSYALMKRGQGDRGDLWENYNIRLIEYEDHGPPLAALLQEIAARAFGAPVAPAPEPAVTAPLSRDLADLVPDGSAMGSPRLVAKPAPEPTAGPAPSAVALRTSRREDSAIAPGPARPIIQRAGLVEELGGELRRS